MNSDLGALAVAASDSAALSLLLKTTLALGAGLVAARTTHRARASVRHIILASAFAAILALPLAAMLLPAVSFDVPVTRAATAQPPPRAAATTPRSAPAAPAPTISSREDTPRTMSAGTIVAAAWFVGALLFSMSFVVAIWRLRAIRRHALPWLEARALVDRLATQAGIHKPVDILLHEEVTAPLTCGLAHPAIILPADAAEWSEAPLRRALVHELEHVRRRDWWTHLTARALCAGYWFHPLAWIAYRQLSLEAERACDDAVVEREEGTQYAEQLVSLARRMAANAGAQPALAMANRSDLARRVSALLDSHQLRGRAGLGRAVTVTAVAAALVLALAPVRAVGAASTVVREETAPPADQARNRMPRIDRALVEAATEGDLADVRELLDGGANVNAEVQGDGSPLIGAVRSGNLPLVTLLLDRGADPNLGVDGDGSPLISAVQRGSVQLVTYLLDRGADPNVGVEGDGSPLIAAARVGSVPLTELLLSRGANIELVVAGDENPLIQGCEHGRLDVVKLLVDRGANVHARVQVENGYPRTQTEWRTPLSMARRGNHREVVAFLLSKGAVE